MRPVVIIDPLSSGIQLAPAFDTLGISAPSLKKLKTWIPKIFIKKQIP